MLCLYAVPVRLLLFSRRKGRKEGANRDTACFRPLRQLLYRLNEIVANRFDDEEKRRQIVV